ncbi:MAG: cell division protein FtsQ/DivIB [Polyangiaceae bacterium]|jgi:cell division protein FtsQ
MTPGNRRVKSFVPRADDSVVPSRFTASVQPHQPSGGWGRALAVTRAVVGVVLVVGAAVGLAWTARRHVMTSPRFAVTEIEVVGNGRRTTADIVAESGLAVGANVFATDLDAARSKVLSDPWISEATLARRLPGTILMQVTERKPASLVAVGDLFLAGADGEPFKKLEATDPVDLPLVTGLSPERLVEDHDGTVRTIRRAVDLAAEYERGALSRRLPLEEVHVEADGAFALVVGKSALELVLGGPPFRRKLDQAARVVAELESRGARAEAIMLDNDTRPDRVVVRMR